MAAGRRGDHKEPAKSELLACIHTNRTNILTPAFWTLKHPDKVEKSVQCDGIQL
jgi:hypothetical protein